MALVVADHRQAAVQAQLERWIHSGEDLHAPAVMPYEVANVFARLAFDGNLAALGIVLHPFELVHDGPAVAAITAQLRRRHATDSTYVRLAMALGTSVWTLDGALARTAADVGLPVELVS